MYIPARLILSRKLVGSADSHKYPREFGLLWRMENSEETSFNAVRVLIPRYGGVVLTFPDKTRAWYRYPVDAAYALAERKFSHPGRDQFTGRMPNWQYPYYNG